jgi:hypothetical protein
VSIDKLKTAAEVIKIASDIYDAFAQRKKKREDEEKDRRIRELEEENARLKESKA